MPTATFTVDEIMRELESLGSELARKTFLKHGVTGPAFGVRYADLYKIQKRIKTDQELADALWNTGNHDARILATLIADTENLSLEKLAEWTDSSDSYVLTTSISIMAAGSPRAQEFAEAWQDEESEYRGQVGWGQFGTIASADNDLPDSYFEKVLEKIEREIHDRKNRVRYSMLGAMIAIGTRNEHLRDLVFESSKRLGKVHVDHGDTSCRTPDPIKDTEKAFNHRHRKKSTK